MTARFLVMEQADAAAVRAAVAELAADGADVVQGWRPPPGGSVVCAGRVATVDDAARAVLAAVRGARLVIDATAPRDVIDQLCDDLRRIGELDHRIAPSRPVLSADERALLSQLLGGATLGQAARTLHLSRRTADRRLASARAALGARTTAEALLLAAEHGLQPPPDERL